MESVTAEEIFEEAVERPVDVCNRCFKRSESTAEMDTVGSGGALCGDNCGTLSASLEEEPISSVYLESRSSNLLSCIREAGYSFDEEIFTEAIDILTHLSAPPRPIFIDAIRAARGEVSLTALREKCDIEDEEDQHTWNVLMELPTSGLPEDLETVDDRVASEITTVADSHRIGSDIYYISDVESIPEKYQSAISYNQDPENIMRTLIESNASWFWQTSHQNVRDWLAQLDGEFCECVSKVLYDHIRARERHTKSDTPSVEEQFRQTSLWPILKEDGENILGFLRRSDGPQSLGDIADHIGRSRDTVWTILMVLETTSPANNYESTGTVTEVWEASQRI
jgi:hypothetical protein